MNLILFKSPEEKQMLPYRDPRVQHIVKVLRKKEGEEVAAGVINGLIGFAKIEEVDKKNGMHFHLNCNEEPPPKAPLSLLIGFPRPIQLRRLLRELCSMGIAAIELVSTELGEKSYRKTKLLSDGGAEAALIEGLAQARDTVLPAIKIWPSLSAWLNKWNSAKPALAGQALADRTSADRSTAGATTPATQKGPAIVCDNIPEARPLPALLRESPKPVEKEAPLTLLIGSERGWSASERAALNSAGIISASMGGRALRTETAAITAAALALAELNFFD